MQSVELPRLAYPAVRFAIDCFEAGGMIAIKPARRGKEIGTNRVLSPEQEPSIRALIYEQRPEAHEAWLEDEYPAIEKQAKAEGGEIAWGDETALVNTGAATPKDRSYAPRGQTPVTMAVGGTRQQLSMISRSPTRANRVG